MMVKVRPSVAVPDACWRVSTGDGSPDTYVRKVANSLLCETCGDLGLDDCRHVRELKVWKKTNNNGG